MLTYIFYAILIFFGFLCVIGLLSFAALLDIFVGIFPYLSYVILIVELIVSVICIGKRISAGNGAVKSFFASAFCLFNSAQYLYYQAQETQILVFLATSLILGPIWLVGVVHPWITVLEDGEGEGFLGEIFLTAALFVITLLWETQH